MLMIIIYFAVFLLSCTLGSIIGIGGSLIARPTLDSIGYHGIANIAFLTSATNVSMAATSIYKQSQGGMKIEFLKVALVCAGSMIGGIIGDQILRVPAGLIGETNMQIAQTTATIVFLGLAIYFTEKCRLRYEIKNKILYVLLGVILGAVAVFLGIGGGPLNVPVFMILFSLPVKQATLYSLAIMVFSHSSRLITMGFTGTALGYMEFDLNYLPFIIPAAIFGGIFGAKLSKKMSDHAVKRTFSVAMCLIIAINLFNLVSFIKVN